MVVVVLAYDNGVAGVGVSYGWGVGKGRGRC